MSSLFRPLLSYKIPYSYNSKKRNTIMKKRMICSRFGNCW